MDSLVLSCDTTSLELIRTGRLVDLFVEYLDARAESCLGCTQLHLVAGDGDCLPYSHQFSTLLAFDWVLNKLI